MTGPLTVLLVDDHVVVRRGLNAFLDVVADIDAVGEAGDGAEALAILARLDAESRLPDIVLIDLMMPGMDGAATVREIGRRHPSIRCVVLTGYAEVEYAHSALSAGAAGYVMKDADPAEVELAIRAAARGEVYLAPSIAAGLTSRMVGRSSIATLTARERDALALLAAGLSNRDIAGRMHISERTARTHVSNVLAKLSLSSRTQAALLAVREGLVGPTAR